jgi:integrase
MIYVYDIWDIKLTGFIVRVNPTGAIVYRCEYGRGKRITLGKASILTPAQARDRAKQILADVVKGHSPEIKKTSTTLNKFIENEYETWRYANRKGAYKDIPRIKKQFSSVFGHQSLLNITPLAIDKWRSRQITRGLKPVTVNRDISLIKSMLNKAVEWGFITENPLQKYKLSRIDSSAKIRYLTKQEEINLMEAIRQRENKIKSARSRANNWRRERSYSTLPDIEQFIFADHITPMIVLSLHTGLRQGKLFNLRWENINFERALLTITGDTAKNGKTRHLPINSYALQVLHNWHKQSHQNELLFSSKLTGKPFNNVKKAWNSILNSAEIKNFRWHDMHHHFGHLQESPENALNIFH